MTCTNPLLLPDKNAPFGYRQVPCGHCLACRIAHSREWSTRLMHELPYWDKSCFVTLTYDNEHLPKDNSLHKEHLQLFFKRLRRDLDGKPFKYFACGEYGDKEHRPHYHGIFFGVGQEDKPLMFENWKKCDYRRFDVGTVTYDSCRYVSDYIFKKYNGEKAISEYQDREPPFQLLSKGIGLSFVHDHEDELKEMGFVYVRGEKVSIPRYYLKKLDWKPEQRLDERIRKRAPYWNDKDKRSALIESLHLGFDVVDNLRSEQSNAQKALNLQAKQDMKNRPL